ncbi:nuclear transport factor 2 family protein [Fulvivirga sp. RKSG066]|uniref:nuclear transport factor 2 family protein n=1 Tax=Fulvivirga aurantia TaxID=2529383 RepID=UPI0012BD2FA2|nr:nuclear transport factor 2 family protein [Fulvivirga aurantia]MTI20271.1 nuclear transport factor 2 family protein [Fulvivirga aurantia]
MKFLLIASIVFITACSGSKEEAYIAKISQADTTKLTKIKKELWPKAYHEHDTALLNKILHEEFEMISNSGEWSTKTDEMDWLLSNSSKPDSFFYEIKRLDIFKNGTAVIAGTGHVFNDSSKMQYQSSNVLVKENKEWKAILSHVSGVQQLD